MALNAYTGAYDSWNRLVKLVDPSSGNIVQTNAYDGRRYRTIRNDYTAGVRSETRHYFYTAAWQSIEERVGTSASPERQLVWGLRFIDDIALRDRDTTGGGTLDERLFAFQDPLGSVVAIANASGTVRERYAYVPYGAPRFSSPSFASQSGTLVDWETLFAAYRADLATLRYQVRERIFDCAIGQWDKRDPIGYRGGINLYNYVQSNPTNLLDSAGLASGAYWGAQLTKRLMACCESCAPPAGCNCFQCRADAERFGEALANTIAANYNYFWHAEIGLGSLLFGAKDDSVGGHLCNEWAWGFNEAFANLPSGCFTFSVEGASPVNSGKYHLWVVITCPCTGKSVYVDDGFGPTGNWVNDAPPRP